ncbi:MAG: hypothetical protein ACYDFT_01860 [Thermoplasmata archaeon]
MDARALNVEGAHVLAGVLEDLLGAPLGDVHARGLAETVDGLLEGALDGSLDQSTLQLVAVGALGQL